MVVSINWGSFLWGSLQSEPYALESILGPPVFGNSQVATPEARSDVLVVAFPRTLRSAARSVSSPEVADAFSSAAGASCVAMREHRPNSWVEVDVKALLSKVHLMSVRASAGPKQRRRISVLLSSDAFSYDALLAGRTMASSPYVVALFVENVAVALQLASKTAATSRRTRPPEVVLLSQPAQSNLCSLVKAGVAITVHSFRWILANRGRCQQPVSVHLEAARLLFRRGEAELHNCKETECLL